MALITLSEQRQVSHQHTQDLGLESKWRPLPATPKYSATVQIVLLLYDKCTFLTSGMLDLDLELGASLQGTGRDDHQTFLAPPPLFFLLLCPALEFITRGYEVTSFS